MYEAHTIYHLYNQGVNREKVFFHDRHYQYFLDKIKTHICPIADVLAYCLMPNHYHIL